MALREAWTRAADDRLPPKEQAKLWGLREALRKLDQDDTQYAWMASKVRVNGQGDRHPGRQSVREFFERVDKDPAGWYPGSRSADVGAPTQLTPAKRKAITTSMMCAKQRGVVPSYDLAKALCPRATTNDGTHAPFSRQAINALLTTECYDDTPDKPWEFRFGCKRRALSKQEQDARAEWGTRLRRENLPATWFLNNIIWLDICAKVIPGNPKKALDQQRTAENKKKRLISPGSSNSSANLGGSSTADKQCSFGDTRVFFGAVLTRGVFGVVVFTEKDEFPGETPEGAGILVRRLPALLDRMLGRSAKKPRMIFTDRGPGFFHRRWGTITSDYEVALREHKFQTWTGTNALKGPRGQPGDIGDMLLHETAISWLRRQEEKSRPVLPWEETPQEFAARLQRAVDHINTTFKVRAMSLEFPDRLDLLVNKTKGDRLPK